MPYLITNSKYLPLPTMQINQDLNVEHIYDKYASLLYGMILKISPNEKKAESILVKSFKIILSQPFTPVQHKDIFLHLLRIVIVVIAEHTHISKQEIGRLLLENIQQIGLRPFYNSIPD